MKTRNLLFTAFFFGIIPLFVAAQVKIEVIQQNVNMSKGEQPAYIVEIPEATYEVVLNDWIKIIRQDTKSKVEETEHEIIILSTHIKDIIGKPINIYSAVIKVDTAVKIVAAFEIDSVFFALNDENKTVHHEKTHHHIQNFMKDFAVTHYHDFVNEEFENAEKLLKTKNKEYKDISKEIENYQKEIKENEQAILNSKDLISSYEGENERKLSEVNNKKESIASLSGDDELAKQAKDQLKALENEKKNIQNKLEKENKYIVKYQSEIEEANRQIEDLREQQLEKKAEIEQQEDIITSIKTKLDGIK
jgi:hypothetical protein